MGASSRATGAFWRHRSPAVIGADVVLDGLSEAEQHALTRADNRIALTSGWDETLLVAELRNIAAAGAEDDRSRHQRR